MHLGGEPEGAVYGCTDSESCNYNPDANLDDSSCHDLCQYCYDGTVWNEEVYACIPTDPSDYDADGCVGMADLLDLLSAFGTCAEVEPNEDAGEDSDEDPDSETDSGADAWSCGDPLEYQGYDYETVQVGEQCWFAENLRAESFANGESIATELNDGEWVSTTSAAMTIFGWGESGYDGGPPNVAQNLEVLGRLYNGYAAQDPRGLCPAGWQVPTDAEWGILEGFMGMSPEEVVGFGYRGSDEGLRLKSANSPYFYWEGVDDVGFSAIGAGRKNGQDGFFHNPGSYGFWWTSTSQTEDLLVRRMLHAHSDKVNRESTDSNEGFSVRCIKNAE